MAACGYISAANFNHLVGARNLSKFSSSDATISLSFGGSDSMGLSLRPAPIRAPKRNHFSPLRVVCVDYPRPELENTVNFVEAAYLSSTFRASPRPLKPLNIVIAGAGINQAMPMLVPISFYASKLYFFYRQMLVVRIVISFYASKVYLCCQICVFLALVVLGVFKLGPVIPPFSFHVWSSILMLVCVRKQLRSLLGLRIRNSFLCD